MARYAVVADLTKRVTGLRLANLTANDATVKEDALDRACNEVDLYLSGGNTPSFDQLDSVGQATVRDLTLDVAVYRLAERMAALDDRTVAQYDAAIFRLRDIAKGVASLGQMGQRVDAQVIRLGSAERVFSADTMRGW